MLLSVAATFGCVVGCLSCAWSLARLLAAAAADIVVAWCTYVSVLCFLNRVVVHASHDKTLQQVDALFFLWGNTLVFRFPLATFIHMVVVVDIYLFVSSFGLFGDIGMGSEWE